MFLGKLHLQECTAQILTFKIRPSANSKNEYKNGQFERFSPPRREE